MKRWMVLSLVLLVLGSAAASAQGPYAAQIQTALRGFIEQAHTWTVTQTITNTGIGTTTAAGLLIQNTTAAAAGAQQYSPGISQIGQGWKTDATAASQAVETRWEVRPVQGAAAPTFNAVLMGRVNAGAWSDLLTVASDGQATTGSSITSGGGLNLASTSGYTFTNRTDVRSPADGLLNINNNAITFGIQVNTGTAAPTFNNGTVTTGSRNTAGQITLTGANTGGVLTFGTPAWTNAPFCILTGSASMDLPQITAVSTTSVTVAGFTANGVFTYHCLGRI